MELLSNDYEIYTYKQRENIQYIITSTVVAIEGCDYVATIKLKDSTKLFYPGFTLYNDFVVGDKVEIIYKLIVEDHYLKALIVDIRKL